MSNIRDFGAKGDGRSDDTDAVQHAIEASGGFVEFPPGDYLITRTVMLNLPMSGRTGLTGSAGAAKVIMAGAGAAFHFVGSHGGTAQPEDFHADVWRRERMPTILNLEIEGRHPLADGILLEGTMQSTFEGLLLRELRHGIRIHGRARNVLVSH